MPPKPRPPPSRAVTVSKALSLLLRHAAEKEGLKMDAQGYANVADVLAWRKLKSLKVTFPEVVEAVASSDKKRFALLYAPPTTTSGESTDMETKEKESTASTDAKEECTAAALAASTTDSTPTHYLIRATQGHSIKSVEATHLLEKLSLEEKDKLPGTVVHGTFHSAWPAIVASGGLRCMGRNQVHFATGPAVEEVIGQLGQKMENGDKGKVISGMRRDAQVLIYVDVERALAAGCPFWRSENGVILSEGIDVVSGGEGGGNGEKMVPLEFVDVVVERKLGMGKIWERGQVVQQWPSEWAQGRNPKGRGSGPGSDGKRR
ncbi:hypothetical protein BO78DRAFT_341864 [Aspergillus sclerotiicarbonarius CBS 121057]|uniref:2'-phosphotransferase n=1 Tax=Aspergillus sclerotiicarbonarius (strain CBS 121057 / IBT 28362) TaxID=1448318 RepID=A0A319EAZ0_ASPSB|nr:hypothetical protein BO78DRAFT_341864 [Aspergillus sclerotiicarbonarius CBS 121057]